MNCFSSLMICLTLSMNHLFGQDIENLKIRLIHNSATEVQARDQLTRLLNEYQPDIERWIYTDEIIIDDSTYIPHSHPVLTINTRYLDNDLRQLSTFVHEQFHWLEEERSEQRELAITDFKKVYPDVPARGGMGARSVYSTYLHLVVCDLEYQAMTKLLGEDKARDLLADKSYYRWIYDQVLNDKRVREINAKHGFIID